MTLSVAPGTLIDDRYRVISRVGSGGMAEVYCAEDVQLGRRVAVKLLHERFAQDEEFVERFRREASSAASLSHANIVSVYDRGEWGGTYYIAMEYLDGRSLDSIVREEAPLAPERAIEITEQVLRAARFAHRREIIHRDLKPHNVIIDEEGRVKVTDFGIARAGTSEITQTGSIIGTARYLSPEQAQGQPVSPRSDLYAIGIMLYELLTGTVPFEGDSVVSIALRHLSEPPRPPSSLVPTLSPTLDAIVLRALAKNPEQRFRDADEFLAALEGERARMRDEAGSHTAALAPIAAAPYPHPATYTTQAIGPITGAHSDASLAWWDPNSTGIIPPGTVVNPAGARRDRRPVWPWALLGVVLASAAVVILVYLLAKPAAPTAAPPTVPQLVGRNVETAIAILGEAGYTGISQFTNAAGPAGTVLRESPPGGTRLAKGAIVRLFVARAAPVSTQIPNVLNQTVTAAQAELTGAGFKVSVTPKPSATVPTNEVISTSPDVGLSAPRGSEVVLFVSGGPAKTAVPNVVGTQLADARLLLQQRQFVVTVTMSPSSQPSGTVLSQTPDAGKAPQGSTIALVVASPQPNVSVPFLVGLPEATAAARLGKLGLTPVAVTVIKTVHPDYDGLVIAQLPRSGASVAPGAEVKIRVESYRAPTGPTGASGASGATGVSGTSGPTGTS